MQQDFIGQGHYSKVKRCTTTPPNQCPYQVSTSYTLRFPRYSPDKIFELKVATARSKVKSLSDHDIAHLHPLTNIPTKYQLPTHLAEGLCQQIGQTERDLTGHGHSVPTMACWATPEQLE